MISEGTVSYEELKRLPLRERERVIDRVLRNVKMKQRPSSPVKRR